MPKNEATHESSKSHSPRNVMVSEENVHWLEEEVITVHDRHLHSHDADHEGLNSGHHHHLAA